MNTDVTDSLGTLATHDIAALKQADWVTFHHLPTDQGGPQIRLYIDGHGDPRIFTASEQRLFPQTGIGAHDRSRIIPVTSGASGFGANDDESGWRGIDRPNLSCFYMIHTAQFSAPWRTITRLLRAGDRLTLSWLADNNTDIVRDAGLHID